MNNSKNTDINLTTIHLEGSLGNRFGRIWKLDVKSPAEAIRAIDINTGGLLREYLSGPASKKYYKVALQKKANAIDQQELTHRSGRSDIWIIPTIKGSSAAAKIIVGAILIIVGVILYSYGGQFLISAGISLILGGIVQLLTPTPQGPTTTDENPSFLFRGSTNPSTQGSPVPVVYGRALVSPLVIGIGLNNQDLNSTAPVGLSNSLNTVDLPNSQKQYTPTDPYNPYNFPGLLSPQNPTDGWPPNGQG